MTNTPSAIFVFLGLFLTFRGLRIFLRAGQTGELIRTAGIIIFVGSYFIHNVTLAIVGFIMFNIGWIYLVTIENDIRKAMYDQTTISQRLIGNIPKIDYKKTSEKAYDKKIGIITGILCGLLALIFLRQQQNPEITDFVFIGVLGFAGTCFVVFSIFKKDKKIE